MKTLGRILIIVLAVAIISGGAYALLQTSTAQALVGQPIGPGSENGNRLALPDFSNGQGGGYDERGGSWATVEQNLLEMVAIIAAVQVVWSIGRGIKRMAEKHNR